MLIRGGDPTTRRACSVILHSLTSTKSVRAEMVSRGGIPLLRLLSADRDNAALRCVALALLRLASEDAGLLRLASEGGVLALNAVVLKCAATQQTRTVRACAHALHALSRKPELHGVLILQRQQQVQQGEATPGVNESEATEDGGALGALMAILRASSAAQDHSTVHFALFALCNLLALADNHGPIQRSGGIPTLVHLCRHAGLRHHDLRAPCAYAIFTLTRTHAEARQEAVASGAIPVLVGLVNESGEEGEEEEDGQGQQQAQHDQRRLLRAFCAATLALLATDTDNLPVMLEEGVLATFVRLLQDRSETTTVRFCCAALCRFARDADVCLRVLESGAVPHLIAGAMEGERGAGQACCTVLAALSAQPDSRQRLCQQHPDVLPALLSLAATDDEATKLRCAATLANLSCERLARGLMVRHGVVRVLADLSTSYSEEAQAHCATALCNLACLEGEEPAVVAQGGLGALMMIGMVRAVSLPTKRLCAQAMLNLLTPQTLGAATEEGLVPACATLSKLEDEASMAACALIFARLSTDARARRQLAEKVGALHALIHLMRARSLHTQLVVGQSVCNLLTAADSRPMALREGGLGVLKEIVELLADDDEGDEEERREMKEDEAAARDGLEGYITQTLFRLCQLPDHRPRLLAADMTPVVLTLLARTGGPVGEHKARRDLCVRMLALFLWHAEARAQFVRHGGVALLVRVMRSGDGEDEAGYRMVAETCVRAAVYLALEPELQPALLKGQVLPAVRHLHASQRLTVRSYEMVALLLRLLTAGCTDPASPSASLALPLLQAGGLSLLRALVTVLQHHSGALLHCTVAVFNFVLEREALEAFAATEDQEQPAADEEVTAVLEAVLVALGDKPACRPLVSAVLAQLSVGLSRYGLLVQMDGVLPLVHRFLLLAPADQEGPLRDPTTALIIQNACATVLALSKASPVCRLQLQRAGFLPHLLHLSKTPSMGPAIVQLAANALRRLSSTVSAPAMDVGRAGGRGGSVAGVKEGAVAALIATALDSPLTAEQESGPDELPPAVPAMEPADALPYAPPETAQGVDHEQLQRELVLQATSAPKIAARARVAALPDVPESSSVSLEFDAAVPTLATGLPTAIDLPTSSLQGFKGARRDGDEDDNEDAEQDDVRAAFAGKLGLPAGVLLLAEPDILEEVERERQQLKASQLAAGGSASQQRRGAAAGGGPSRRPGALAGPGSSRLTALRKPRSTILYRTSSSASDDGPPSPYAEVLTHKSSATSVFGSTGGSSSSAVGGTPRGAGKRRMKAAALLVRTSLLALGGGGGGRDSQSTPQEAEEGKEGAAADGPDGSLQSTMEEGGEREADGAEGGEEAGGAHESSQPPTSPPPQQQKSQQQQHPSSLPPPDPKRGSTTNTSVAAGLSAAGMLKGGELERPAAAAKAGVISAGATTAVNKSAAPSPFLRLDEDALLQLQPPLPIDHAGKTRLADPFDKSEESLVHNMRMPHSFTGATTVASASSRRGDGRGAAGGSGARRPAGGTGK